MSRVGPQAFVGTMGMKFPDYSGVKSNDECVKEQIDASMLDLLLLEDVDEAVEHAETSTLFDYQHTEFEADRARIISDGGVTLAASAMNGSEFMETYLKTRTPAGKLDCDLRQALR